MIEPWQEFVAAWEDCPAKEAFARLHAAVVALDGVCLSGKVRPGVSVSVRGGYPPELGRELFVLVDIIDDDPDARWLSVCGYADLLDDPEERGDVVPKGLLGADARCFDLDGTDAELVEYVVQRITAAGLKARK
jgi:hypothetical protein